VARFPDSQVGASRLPSHPPTSAFAPPGRFGGTSARQWLFTQGSCPEYDVTLAAYSGGTVWASHPLRVAAGVSVKLSGQYINW